MPGGLGPLRKRCPQKFSFVLIFFLPSGRNICEQKINKRTSAAQAVVPSRSQTHARDQSHPFAFLGHHLAGPCRRGRPRGRARRGPAPARFPLSFPARPRAGPPTPSFLPAASRFYPPALCPPRVPAAPAADPPGPLPRTGRSPEPTAPTAARSSRAWRHYFLGTARGGQAAEAATSSMAASVASQASRIEGWRLR